MEADWINSACSSDIPFLEKIAKEKGFIYWRIIDKKKCVLFTSEKLSEVNNRL